MRFDQIAAFIKNTNDNITGAAVKFRIADPVACRIRLAIPELSEWQSIGDQIDATFIFAWSNLVNMCGCHYEDDYAFPRASNEFNAQNRQKVCSAIGEFGANTCTEDLLLFVSQTDAKMF